MRHITDVHAESVFDKSIQDLNAKSIYIQDSEKKIQKINHEIDCLQTTLASFEVCPFYISKTMVHISSPKMLVNYDPMSLTKAPF
jgi:hypothetical protein